MGDTEGMFDWEDEALQDESLDLQGKVKRREGVYLVVLMDSGVSLLLAYASCLLYISYRLFAQRNFPE